MDDIKKVVNELIEAMKHKDIRTCSSVKHRDTTLMSEGSREKATLSCKSHDGTPFELTVRLKE